MRNSYVTKLGIVREIIGLVSDTFPRGDLLWVYLRIMKKPGTIDLEFKNLFKVTNVVLTIQHSNAGEERIFSLTRLLPM